MPSIMVTIQNKLGLHARAAAQFVKLTNRYKAEVVVAKQGRQVNGKSIMGVMMLAASKGSQLMISADGPDADEILARLSDLIQNKFGEE
ncbi:MAG: HPr family phosphocarrier protein [Candidatus Tectomicrobia bacterium]|nr:HPr family phosphocarrier protein [Candidatus Tectomicrobia bacterium]